MGLETIIYKRYVDDIILIIKSLAGFKYNSQTMSVDQKHDYTLLNDQVTMSILSSIVNQIEENLQTTYDYPSLNADFRMLALDLKIWLDSQTGRCCHVFYKNPMPHPLTIMQRSAISSTVKRATLFQEGI